MGSFKSQLQNLDTLKELCLIHQQIDNMNSNSTKVYQLNKIVTKPKISLNVKERFRIAVNEFRQKIDMERKMMHGKIS